MKSPRSSAAFCAVLLLLLSAHAYAQDQEQRVKFKTLAKYTSCGHTEKKNYVVTSYEQWDRLWGIVASNSYPRPSPPDVDFTRHTLIAVFQGFEPSSGYDITITKLTKSDDSVFVLVKEDMPEDACKEMLVTMQPFHIILIKKVDEKNVYFKVKQRIKHCQ
jgi:hypothetical protein